MSSGFLRNDGKKIIKQYADAGVLKSSQITALWNAESYEEMIEALSLFVELDNGKCERLWMYIIHNVWKGVADDDSRETVFGEEENIFFRELLKNKGVVTRTFAIDKVFKTPYICKEVVDNLIEMQIIDSYQLRNWEVVYVLNLNFYKEVFKDDSDSKKNFLLNGGVIHED
jgi:hypothetical protein